MNSFYIGWTSDAYRTDLLPEPEAPSNYKDPAKIAAAVAAKKEKQEADARFSPFYGKLSSICMLSPAGDVLLQHNDGEQDMDTGTMFTDFLMRSRWLPWRRWRSAPFARTTFRPGCGMVAAHFALILTRCWVAGCLVSIPFVLTRFSSSASTQPITLITIGAYRPPTTTLSGRSTLLKPLAS